MAASFVLMMDIRFRAGDYRMCVAADGFIAGGGDNRRRFARDWADSGLAEGQGGWRDQRHLGPAPSRSQAYAAPRVAARHFLGAGFPDLRSTRE
jgi:hypothetical protein